MRTYLIIATKLTRGLTQLPYLPRILGLVWTAARGWFLAWACLLVIQALLPVATVYLTRAVVDRLAAMVTAGEARPIFDSSGFDPILIWGVLLLVVALLSEGVRGVIGWVQTAQAERVQDHIRALIHQKSMQVDLAFYDSPDYYDHLHRARDDAEGRPLILIDHIGVLGQHSLTLLAMGAVLAPFGLWLPIALLISALPACMVVIQCSIRHHQWWLRTTAEERRAWYYDWLITTGDMAAELRLFGLGPRFQTAYQTLRRKLHLERLQLAKTQSWAEIAASTLAVGVAGQRTAGLFGKPPGLWTLGKWPFYQAFHQGQRLIRGILENVGQIYTNLLFLESLFDFLDLEPRVIDVAEPIRAPRTLRQGICFRQVDFRYPGSRTPALRGFNLDIPVGQIVAIVGDNGLHLDEAAEPTVMTRMQAVKSTV